MNIWLTNNYVENRVHNNESLTTLYLSKKGSNCNAISYTTSMLQKKKRIRYLTLSNQKFYLFLSELNEIVPFFPNVFWLVTSWNKVTILLFVEVWVVPSPDYFWSTSIIEISVLYSKGQIPWYQKAQSRK